LLYQRAAEIYSVCFDRDFYSRSCVHVTGSVVANSIVSLTRAASQMPFRARLEVGDPNPRDGSPRANFPQREGNPGFPSRFGKSKFAIWTTNVWERTGTAENRSKFENKAKIQRFFILPPSRKRCQSPPSPSSFTFLQNTP
jgi:hypothetical protein